MTRQTGVVAKWLNHKGIGFITPEGEEGGEGKDILVHFTELKQETEDGFKSLETGTTVEYDLETDPKNAEKKIAVRVTGTGGADCPPRKKGRGKKRSETEGDAEEGEDAEEKEKRGSSKGKGKGKGKKGKGKKGKGKGKSSEE